MAKSWLRDKTWVRQYLLPISWKLECKGEQLFKKPSAIDIFFSRVRSDKIRPNDKVAIYDLVNLAPRRPVKVTLRHSDGSNRDIVLKATFNSFGLEWIKWVLMILCRKGDLFSLSRLFLDISKKTQVNLLKKLQNLPTENQFFFLNLCQKACSNNSCYM